MRCLPIPILAATARALAFTATSTGALLLPDRTSDLLRYPIRPDELDRDGLALSEPRKLLKICPIRGSCRCSAQELLLK